MADPGPFQYPAPNGPLPLRRSASTTVVSFTSRTIAVGASEITPTPPRTHRSNLRQRKPWQTCTSQLRKDFTAGQLYLPILSRGRQRYRNPLDHSGRSVSYSSARRRNPEHIFLGPALQSSEIYFRCESTALPLKPRVAPGRWKAQRNSGEYCKRDRLQHRRTTETEKPDVQRYDRGT